MILHLKSHLEGDELVVRADGGCGGLRWLSRSAGEGSRPAVELLVLMVVVVVLVVVLLVVMVVEGRSAHSPQRGRTVTLVGHHERT